MIDWDYINNLEKNYKYKEVYNLLKKEWVSVPQDLKITIYLGFLCWYTVVEWSTFEHNFEESEYSIVEETLIEVTKSGINMFNKDVDFLWMFGYMISLFPYYFGVYEEWEYRGKKMIEEAKALRPNDPIIEMLYLAGVPSSKYKDSCKRAKPIVLERFNGEGKLNEYFRDVLDR